jgi:hypothetical protein
MAYGKSRIVCPRVVRLEAIVREDDQPRLDAICRELQQVANLAVRRWLAYHEQRDTLARIAERKPAAAWPADFAAAIRAEAAARHAGITYSTLNGLLNWMDRTFSKQDSPRAHCKRWVQVLRCEESHWSYSRPLPIRLWSGNARLVMDERGPVLVARLNRRVEPGKCRPVSDPITIRFRRPGRGKDDATYRAGYAQVCAIARGEAHFAQSQLWRQKQKWFCGFTVDLRSNGSHRDPNLTIFIRPGRMNALRVHANRVVGGYGDWALDRIAAESARLAQRRSSLRAQLEQVPPHIQESLSARWRNVTVTVAQQLVSRLMKALRDEHYGRVVWLDGNNRTAALATAGKTSGRDPRELFPFEFMRRFAQQKCEQLGIAFASRANFRSVKRRKFEHKKRRSSAARVQMQA